MKKLGKKAYEMKQTVEAYAVSCLSHCEYPCHCYSSDMSASDAQNEHMILNDQVYVAVYHAKN